MLNWLQGRKSRILLHFPVTCTLDNIATMTSWPNSVSPSLFFSLVQHVYFHTRYDSASFPVTDCDTTSSWNRLSERRQYTRKPTPSSFQCSLQYTSPGRYSYKWSQGSASYRERVSGRSVRHSVGRVRTGDDTKSG